MNFEQKDNRMLSPKRRSYSSGEAKRVLLQEISKRQSTTSFIPKLNKKAQQTLQQQVPIQSQQPPNFLPKRPPDDQIRRSIQRPPLQATNVVRETSIRGRTFTTTIDVSAFNHSDESDNGIGLCGWLLTMISWLLVVVTLPFSLCVCFKVVQEYERAVIFRLGRLLSGGSRGPGIFFVLPCIESYQKVDLRTITLGVPPQEVLTKDSVTVSVDAVVYYRVSNATVSVANVENAHHSTRLLAQTTLRNILGTKNLHEILSDRESISGSMQSNLDEATAAWGIKVERVEIKDARLPVQLQRAMAAEAEAAREARAKVIAAEGEQKASRALREASKVIAESSSALQLRYLQTLNSISAEKNSTIIFPLPIDFLSHFLNRGNGNSKEVHSEKKDD
ncbi:band 7 protein AGAP004871 isoform X5 [Lepeophtheirus salmonis]|uniref:band 7 protein AGAP004871 isoform X5 n=1 Tax=Lepeophtheirus salmonis TaxID=72036 RepID=UPI001AE9E4F6|nr:band 7 protein AGAP004871-like isoform X1 [Lepeophtheirus salmonis]